MKISFYGTFSLFLPLLSMLYTLMPITFSNLGIPKRTFRYKKVSCSHLFTRHVQSSVFPYGVGLSFCIDRLKDWTHNVYSLPCVYKWMQKRFIRWLFFACYSWLNLKGNDNCGHKYLSLGIWWLTHWRLHVHRFRFVYNLKNYLILLPTRIL